MSYQPNMRKLVKRAIYLYLTVFLVLALWWGGGLEKRLSSDVVLRDANVPADMYKVKADAQGNVNILAAVTRKVPLETVNIVKSLLDDESDTLVRSNWFWTKDNSGQLNKYVSVDITLCDGKFQAFDKSFALLKNVTIETKFGVGRKGGENITDVINQKEDDEYFKLKKGYFQLACSKSVNDTYKFNPKSHLNAWFDSCLFTKDVESLHRINEWTIAVLRYEYANLYHTMTDYYNAFLLAKTFQLDPDNVNILFVDGHPKGALDTTWQYLFKSFIRAGEMQTATTFNNLVWNIMGYDSPLSKHSLNILPYLEEFREFFLSRHGVSTHHALNCKKLTVMFLWRRDYLAHPRNPSGTVSRKIKNEDELLNAVQSLLAGHNVYGVQIDKYPMKTQLLLISKADLLIGMHGAGLSHTLFLPKHAGLIEFYPVYWSTSNQHFKSMAKWRGLHYATWNNVDSNNELPDKYTIVDVNKVIEMVKQIRGYMCPKQ